MRAKGFYRSRQVQKGNWITGFRIQRQRQYGYKTKYGFITSDKWKKY